MDLTTEKDFRLTKQMREITYKYQQIMNLLFNWVPANGKVS